MYNIIPLLCADHVIWTGCLMTKLVLNVKYLLLLSFLTMTKFYNLGHIQGIITYKGALTQKSDLYYFQI